MKSFVLEKIIHRLMKITNNIWATAIGFAVGLSCGLFIIGYFKIKAVLKDIYINSLKLFAYIKSLDNTELLIFVVFCIALLTIFIGLIRYFFKLYMQYMRKLTKEYTEKIPGEIQKLFVTSMREELNRRSPEDAKVLKKHIFGELDNELS